MHSKDRRGRTPLLAAALFCRTAAIRELLEGGAHPVARDKEGETALRLALACRAEGKNSSKEEAVAALLEFPFYGDYMNSRGERLIHLAARSGVIRAIDAVITDTTGIDTRDNQGLTALHFAVMGENHGAGAHLVERGSNVNLRDTEGLTPLHIAILREHIKIADLLVSKNAALDACDRKGLAPVHYACALGFLEGVHLLTRSGARLDLPDRTGRTPLDVSDTASMRDLVWQMGGAAGTAREGLSPVLRGIEALADQIVRVGREEEAPGARLVLEIRDLASMALNLVAGDQGLQEREETPLAAGSPASEWREHVEIERDPERISIRGSRKAKAGKTTLSGSLQLDPVSGDLASMTISILEYASARKNDFSTVTYEFTLNYDQVPEKKLYRKTVEYDPHAWSTDSVEVNLVTGEMDFVHDFVHL